jgi:hypothetical protein
MTLTHKSIYSEDSLFYILYSTTLFLFALGSIVANKNIRFQKGSLLHPLVLLSSAYIVFFWGGRGVDVGNDTAVYYWWFEQLHSVQVEPLYYILMSIVHIFTDQPKIFLFIISSMTVFFLYRASYNLAREYNVDFPSVFVLLLMNTAALSMFGSGIRQGLASSLCLYALSIYLTDKKLFKAIVLMLLATLVHKSSITGLIALAIFKINIRFKHSVFILLTAIVISQFNWINGFFEIVHSLLKNSAFSFYTERLINGQSAGFTKMTLGFGVVFYTATALAFVCFFSNREKELKLANLYLMVPIIIFIFHEHSELSARLTVIFKYALPCLFVVCAKAFLHKRLVLLSFAVISYLLLLKGVLITNISSGFYTYSNWIVS